MRYNFYYKGKTHGITAKEVSILSTGLMFTRKEKAKALLFKLDKPRAIHSFYVWFPFLALWIDENDKVVEIEKVRPFRLHIKSKKPFVRLLEIPINKEYEDLVKDLGF